MLVLDNEENKLNIVLNENESTLDTPTKLIINGKPNKTVDTNMQMECFFTISEIRIISIAITMHPIS